jgi:amino acid transporter
MHFERVLLMSVALGLMVSPEALTVVGNSAGKAGHGVGGIILLAGLIHLLTILGFGRMLAQYPGPSGEACLIRKALGAVPAVVSPVCARVTVAVCASTAVLATAGYAFNEVFVYWFPNLGFSFCLLGVLLLLNLQGRKVAVMGQLVFVGLTVAGLLFLSVTGLFEWGNAPPVTPIVGPRLAHLPQVGLACLLLFVGFDLAGFAVETPDNPAKVMLAAILLAGLVFSCWGWVSAEYVPLYKLADTSIPHVKAARAVLGEKGRLWMGLVILAGSSAAVNALLMTVSRMMTAMAADGLLPPHLARRKDQATIALLLLAAAVAAMMGSGMAGEPILEVCIKAGMWFWLLHYGVIQGSLLAITARSSYRSGIRKTARHRVFPIAGMAAMGLALTAMFLLETEWRLLLRLVVTFFGIAVIFAALWIPLSRRRGWLTQCEKTLG